MFAGGCAACMASTLAPSDRNPDTSICVVCALRLRTHAMAVVVRTRSCDALTPASRLASVRKLCTRCGSGGRYVFVPWNLQSSNARPLLGMQVGTGTQVVPLQCSPPEAPLAGRRVPHTAPAGTSRVPKASCQASSRHAFQVPLCVAHHEPQRESKTLCTQPCQLDTVCINKSAISSMQRIAQVESNSFVQHRTWRGPSGSAAPR